MLLNWRVVSSGICLAKHWYPIGEKTVSIAGTQIVRWRKPRWIPINESKKFWVPQRHDAPKEEQEEIKRLYDNYRTYMKALRDHLRRENLQTSATSELASQQAAEEEAEHQRLMEYNHQENEKLAALREKRILERREAEIARVIASKERHEKKKLENEKEALRIIAETRELVKTFIQREDLERAIEAAIENPKDYNFALDVEGQLYSGRKTISPDKEEKEELSVSQ